jgi:hypothetical protein
VIPTILSNHKFYEWNFGTAYDDAKVLFNSAEKPWFPTQGGRSGYGHCNNNGRGTSIVSYGKGRGPLGQFTFCNKLGHTVEQCYSKHGFPCGHKPKNFDSINNTIYVDNVNSTAFI